MRGAGKAGIGRRVGSGLAVPCVEADAEIGQAAGSSIPEIFERHGEAAFREGERRVIARLLRQPVHVLATGGGAFMDETTRATIAECGNSLRSEEHTSALQSLMRNSYAVFCLKKKKTIRRRTQEPNDEQNSKSRKHTSVHTYKKNT